MQLLHGRVALSDLTDLAADGDGDPGRLLLPDELGEDRGQVRVELLLLGQRRQGDVDDGRGIDVDIEVPGRDRLAVRSRRASSSRSESLAQFLALIW